MNIVPVLEYHKFSDAVLAPPNRCYFKGGSHQEFYSRLFSFVDFGTSANSFLNACGTKEEPSAEDIAELMSHDPHKFFELIGGQEKRVFQNKSFHPVLTVILQLSCRAAETCHQYWFFDFCYAG